MIFEKAKIISNERKNEHYFILKLLSPNIASTAKPGQFVNVLLGDDSFFLGRPFSIYDSCIDTISILYKITGRGTIFLSKIKEGEINLIGPLGNYFPAPTGYPLFIAGGYGIAPLHFLSKKIDAGTLIVGAKNASLIPDIDDFLKTGWNTIVSTEDGSYGIKGMVTDAVKIWWLSYVKNKNITAYACGPTKMLYNLHINFSDKIEDIYVSLDRRMGCGVGACLACVISIKNGQARKRVRVCRDGPIFNSRSIVWEEL